MTGTVRFQGRGVRITDTAIETPGWSCPLEEAAGLVARGVLGAQVALVVSLMIMVVIAASLVASGAAGHSGIFYAFLVTWSGLAGLLGYAAVALKGLRIRRADGKSIALAGRFTVGERRQIVAAFAEAKAALAR